MVVAMCQREVLYVYTFQDPMLLVCVFEIIPMARVTRANFNSIVGLVASQRLRGREGIRAFVLRIVNPTAMPNEGYVSAVGEFGFANVFYSVFVRPSPFFRRRWNSIAF